MPDPGQLVLSGIARLEAGDWESALRYFDEAIAHREAGDWKNHPLEAWGLAAAHINRSDALRRSGNLPEAILSLRMAIQAMAHVPLAEHPAYPERLLLAWINLATAFEESHQPGFAEDAFSMGFSVMETWGGQTTPNRKFLSAMFHTNRARFHLGMNEPEAAWRDAGISVGFLDGIDSAGEVVSASIHARGILCQSLAHILDTPDGVGLETDWIARATDTAEEALQLARLSDYRGEWIPDLVLYCARIYRICQPHFLSEFLCETIVPGSPVGAHRDLISKLANELQIARRELESRVMTSPHDTELIRKETETLRKLQFAETHLRQQTMENDTLDDSLP